MFLLCLLLVVATAEGYVNLTTLSYVRLEDANGAFTIDASSYNRISFDNDQGIVYVLAMEPARLTVFSLGLDGTLTQRNVHAFNKVVTGEPLDIEFCKPSLPSGNPRLAISFQSSSNTSTSGHVRLYTPLTASNFVLGSPLHILTVGSMPVDMEFGQDCMLLLTANQGWPVATSDGIEDPLGSVTRITLPVELTEDSSINSQTIDFSSVVDDNSQLIPLMEKNFRPFPLSVSPEPIGGMTASKNVEPTHVILASNGLTAYVALPKNNAIARINLDTNSIDQIFPLGERSWQNFYVDLSQSDNDIVMSRYPIFSTYMPRMIKWVMVDDGHGTNMEWMISMDSGFIDVIPEYNYVGARPGNVLASGADSTAPGVSVDANLLAQMQNMSQLGEAMFSIEDGRTGDQLTKLYINGGRGISIRNGTNLLDAKTFLVDNLEREMAKSFRSLFNSAYVSPDHTPAQDVEETSPTYGPDLNAIESGIHEGQKILFMGSSSSGIIYTYVLVPGADCPQPFFHSAVRSGNIFATWQNAYNEGQMGDIGISDMLYIPRSGPRIIDVLLVASATSNSIHSYRVSDV